MSAFGWCPHAEDHTPCPEGYIQWHAWAAQMSKTHRQEKCGECGRFTIWIPKSVRHSRVHPAKADKLPGTFKRRERGDGAA